MCVCKGYVSPYTRVQKKKKRKNLKVMTNRVSIFYVVPRVLVSAQRRRAQPLLFLQFSFRSIRIPSLVPVWVCSPLSALSPPSLHPLSTLSPPSLHPLSTLSPPSLHPLSTLSPPSLPPLFSLSPPFFLSVFSSSLSLHSLLCALSVLFPLHSLFTLSSLLSLCPLFTLSLSSFYPL